MYLGIRPAAAETPARSYEGYQIARVTARSAADLRTIERTGGVILNCVPGIGPLDVAATPDQLSLMAEQGMTFEVRFADVAALLRPGPRLPLTAEPYADFFEDYHPYGSAAEVGSIVWYLYELAARYPGLAGVFDLGVTVEGRTIWGLRIANDAAGSSKPAVLYFGGQHAREWIAATVPNYFATELLAGYGNDPRVTELVDAVEFYLVPVVNVDGYLYSWSTDRLWRKNRRLNANGTFGVDLNRNWEEGWGGPGSASFPASDIYHGPAPFSEPETQALRDFVISHANLRAMLDVHSFSQRVLWPFGYTPDLAPNHDDYFQVGVAMQGIIHDVHGVGYSSGPVYWTLYPAAGISIDWTSVQHDVLSFGIECRDQGLFGFELPADQIVPNNQELFPAFLHLADSDEVRLPVRLLFPDGLPKTLTAGVDTTIRVQLVPQYEQPLPATARLHYQYGPGDFIEAPLTPLGGDRYAAVLPAADCSAAPRFYFSVEGDQGSLATSPRRAPAELHQAVVSTGTESFFIEDLSTNPRWTTEGQWQWGRPIGAGSHSHDPTSGYTGPYVYGYNINGAPTVRPYELTGQSTGTSGFQPAPRPFTTRDFGDYRSDMPATYLTSPPIDCTGRFNVHLRYRRWLGVESNSSFDEATIEASPNGLDWTVVWRATATGAAVDDASWQLHEIDISSIADDQPALQLRWGMGPTDSNVTYPGWNIDDIELTSAVCHAVTAKPPIPRQTVSDVVSQLVPATIRP